MIGNDIVDLKAAARESNWRRRGFLQKLFTTEEQEKILTSSSPEAVVWLFWSMKEAAYKAHQRKYNLKRNYRPKSFVCCSVMRNRTSASGRVQCGETVYFTRSVINKSYIHTTSSFSEEEKILYKIYPSSEDIKSNLISDFAEVHNLCRSLITVKKNKHFIPNILVNDTITEYPFSLSQHGNYSSYMLSLMNY